MKLILILKEIKRRIVGSNGCGKTTTIVMLGLVSPTKGNLIENKNINLFKDEILKDSILHHYVELRKN